VDLAHLRIERAGAEVAELAGHLRGLSPQHTLDRGYAIARRADGTVISLVEQVASGEELHVRVSDGTIDTRVS
jgi:exodeoxyribonuclease VII large subunit